MYHDKGLPLAYIPIAEGDAVACNECFAFHLCDRNFFSQLASTCSSADQAQLAPEMIDAADLQKLIAAPQRSSSFGS